MSPFLLPHASFVHKLKLQLLEASGLQQHAHVKESSSPSILMWKIPEKHSDWARLGAMSTMWLWGQCVMFGILYLYESEILGQIPEPSDWREDKAHFLKEVVIQACQAKHIVVPAIKIKEEGLPTRLTPTGAASSRDPSASASSYEKPTDPVHPETARERWDLSPGTEAQNSVFLWLQEWFSMEMVPYLKEGFKLNWGSFDHHND